MYTMAMGTIRRIAIALHIVKPVVYIGLVRAVERHMLDIEARKL